GNVSIEQHEYERVVNANGTFATDTIDGVTSYVLQPFTQGKALLPIVGDPNEPGNSPAYAGWDDTIVRMTQVDSYGYMNVFAGKNAQDKFVTVENTGKTDAYVRTLVAIECGSGDVNLIGSSYHSNWSKNAVGKVEIDENTYYVYEYIYKGASDGSRHVGGVLPAGETSYPNLSQVYLKSVATNEDMAAIDGNDNGTLDILVISQAVQAAGFDNAETALDAAFGDITTTNHPWTDDVVLPIIINDEEELEDLLTDLTDAGSGSNTVYIADDIDASDIDWKPIKVDGYHGADIITIEGQGKTITGLNAPLFQGGFAGKSGIVIKDLTIADSNIVSTNTIGSGAFIESVDSMQKIVLDNCHLKDSTVTGGNGSRTGGLIGWTAGYNNVNDGPVKTYVTITNCTVDNCTITSNGSVGGIYGHAGNNAWTYSTVENCAVTNCELNSTDDGGWRVGVVVGTANVGEMTISNITESGNTLTQTGKTAPAGQSNLYGRFVPGTTGKLTIDGVAIS
ncbi:MAG: hypothetical protein IJN82_06225, partial [Clostridia bacterium]|nr:hypothetical protein [Clostridia bacterium]